MNALLESFNHIFIEQFLPPLITLVDSVFLVSASFVTSLITAAFGIGGGTVLIALLAFLLPPTALIPIHSVVQLGSNAGRAAIMFRDVHWQPILLFSVGTVIGAGVAGFFVVQIPFWIVQIGLGIFIIWIVVKEIPPIPRHYILLSGVVSSFLAMFFGATGNFVAAIVKSMKLNPVQHVATHSVMATSQHFVKVLVFGIVGFNFAPYLPLITGMLISGFIGTLIGRQFLVRAGNVYFKPILNVMLFLIAIKLVTAGIATFLSLF